MAFADHVAAPSDYPFTHSYAETDGLQAIVWLKGEHDAATVDELSMLLAESIASTRSDVIVDLSGVEFMGAAPVDVLVRAREFLEHHSRALVLRAPSRHAKHILELCGVDLDSTPAPARADAAAAAPALASFVPVPATAPGLPGEEAPAPNPTVPAESAKPAPTGEPVSRVR